MVKIASVLALASSAAAFAPSAKVRIWIVMIMEIEIDREKRRWLILREDGDSFETRERDEDTTESEC